MPNASLAQQAWPPDLLAERALPGMMSEVGLIALT